jgi:pimeloyl-ACP methyl ester carboxylesterase
MMVRPQRASIIEKGEVPLLWILGRDDRYFSPEAAMRSIRIPANAQVVILEKSGHLGFIEEPGLSSELISAFARKLNWRPETYKRK